MIAINLKRIFAYCESKGYRIATAESCTGGMVASAIVGTDGASRVLKAGIVAYTAEAKQQYTDVTAEMIERYGIVSEEVASAMALGVAKNNEAQIGLATTGIAGPDGGTEEQPVGTVCFAIAIEGRLYACTEHFPDRGRDEVRLAATEFILGWLEHLLMKDPR